MRLPSATNGEARLALKHASVSLVGFAIDATLLHVGVKAGLEPAWARVISLFCAMQVTFAINGLHVFQCLTWKSLPKQWATYMLTNAFGNLCNYWIFVTLVSTHWSLVSTPIFALGVASFLAWTVNYAGARFFAFANPIKSARLKSVLRRVPKN